MSLLLDAVRAERDKLLAPLRDRLNQLDELERLAHAFDGDGEGAGTPDSPTKDAGVLPAAAEKPAEKRARTGGRRTVAGRNGGNAPAHAGARAGSTPSGAGRATPKRDAVLAYVQEHGTVKVADIISALGLPAGAVRSHLRDLTNAGEIQARGATSLRVYFTTEHGDQAERDRPHGTQNGINGKLPDLKQRVAKAIAQDPAALNEDRLALVLNVAREDVAVATGELLVDDQVILMPDGTYRPGLVAA